MRTYDTYKDSGISWLGQIPSHWDVKRARIVLAENASVNSDVSVTKQLQFKYGEIEPKANQSVDDVVKETISKYTVVDKGDIMINGLNLNYDFISQRVAQVQEKGCITSAYVSLRSTKFANSRYYTYYLKAMDNIKMFHGMGSGVRLTLSYKELKNMYIPIPPIEEQRAMADYIDSATAEIDKAIASQQRMVELLQERMQIIINQAVTQGLNPDARLKDTGINWLGLIPAHWEARKLKTICKYDKYSIKTGPFGTQLKGDDLMQNGAVRVYNQKNVIENNFDDVQFYVSKEKARELNSFYTQPQDLLITSRGTIGKCSILPENAPMGLLHPCLIAMRINQKICDLNWAQIFISSSSFFSTNIFLNSNATTIEVIYTDTLKNVVIPLPPLSEQQEIVAYIKREASKVDHALQQTKLKIELLIERKQILINDVVTGKIKVV